MKTRHNIDAISVVNVDGKKVYVIQGWIYDSMNLENNLEILVNHDSTSIPYELIERHDVLKRLKIQSNEVIKLGFTATVEGEINHLVINSIRNDSKVKMIELSAKEIAKEIATEKIMHFFDNLTCIDNVITVNGWVTTSTAKKVDITIKNNKGEEIEANVVRLVRHDVLEALFGEKLVNRLDDKIGFNIQFKRESEKDTYYVEFKSSHGEVLKQKIKFGKFDYRYVLRNLTLKNICRGIVYIGRYGIAGTKQRLMDKKARDQFSYEDFYKYHKCSNAQLQQQREHKFDYEPKISIIVPAYKTPKDFLNQMIDCVEEQTYQNYELCIADGSVDSNEVEEVLKQRSSVNPKIKYSILDKNYGISGNTNAALELATGDYIALLDHDDILAASALYEVVEAINEDIENEVIYTDEDKVDMDLVHHFEPHFKPDFSLDLFRSNNYICHFFIAKKEIVEKVGGFREKYDGSQDYDFILRCTELAKKVKHLHRILYHWRTHMNSTAANPESKMYCFEAGKRAIEDSLERANVKGEVMFTDHLGFYRVKYDVIGNPKVSIIIPNKDHAEVLKVCIDSILTKSTYSNYEIVIVENNSTEDKTFEYYKSLNDERIKVVTWENEFNYSAINNFGVQHATGEYYILLNNDTEIITETWIEEMLGNCQRKEVGICGAKLYYPDNTIQHAGVIVGMGGIAGHVFMNFPRDAIGYFAKCKLQQNLSAVTAACLMVRKDVFEQVGGLEEQLKVAFNDIDFCLKVRKAGYLVVYNPNVELYHYESKSRGKEDTVEKMKRFNQEIAYMQTTWKDILENGDPYYNSNLALDKWDYSFRNNSKDK